MLNIFLNVYHFIFILIFNFRMSEPRVAAVQAMTISMCGPLMNKIKMCFAYPRKNMDLANNKDIKNLVYLLGEQLLP